MVHFVFRRSRLDGVTILALAALFLNAGLVLSRSAAAQSAPPSTFVMLRGADTIGVETVTIDAALIKGTLAMRGQPRMEWEQVFDNRVPGQLTMRTYAPGAAAAAAPLQQVVFAIRGDSARIEQSAGGKSGTTMMAVKPGTVVIIGTSVLHASFVANYARRAGKSALSALNAAGGQMLDASIASIGDTTTFTIAGLPIRTVWRAGSPQLITVAPQGIRAVLTTAPVAPPSSMPMKIDYSAPTNAPYSAEQVSIPTTRGYTLAATLTKPKGVARVPVVITISGSGPQERDSRLAPVPGYAIFREVADTLGKRGIAVLRYDDRGVGENGGRSSAATATSADFADDVRSVIEWLRARPDVDGTRIALAGHSEGGLTDPAVALRKIKQPVLVLQGNTDMQVSPEQADTLSFILRTAGNTRVTVRRFPETNHLFLRDPVGAASGYSALKDPTVRRDVLGTLANFMVTALK